MIKCLITGGAGFIGSNLVSRLVKEGMKIVVLDNLSTGKIDNLKEVQNKIEFIKGDICNYDDVKKSVKECDYIFHLAALPFVTKSIEDPIGSNQVNVNGTLNLLKCASEQKVKKFIFTSSSAVYGDDPKCPKTEDMLCWPISPYGVTKKAGEEYCYVFAKIFGVDTISLRYFNVFGPNQSADSEYSGVISRFIYLFLNEKIPTIFGDGFQSRDFTYVDDIVEANLLAAKCEETKGEVVNIACGKSINLNQMVEIMNKIMGLNIKPIYASQRIGDIKHSLSDISKSNKLLNYFPKVSFEEGLKRTIEWFKLS
ncbi:MAG: SDR family oxidoreductase [bacterium]